MSKTKDIPSPALLYDLCITKVSRKAAAVRVCVWLSLSCGVFVITICGKWSLRNIYSYV